MIHTAPHTSHPENPQFLSWWYTQEVTKKVSSILENIDIPLKILTQIQNRIKAKDFSGLEQAIYWFLTQRREYFENYAGDESKLWKLKEKYTQQCVYYKEVLEWIESYFRKNQEMHVSSNPAWFAIKSNTYYPDIPSWGNYKIYKTISIQDYTYIAKLIPLAKQLEEVAKNTQDTISLKIPGGFLWFLSHNDSLVVHFKKRENQAIIDSVIQKWQSDMSILPQKREWGRTEFAKDSEERSFSENIAKVITNWIKENNSYSPEILANHGIKWAVYLSTKSEK